jgi:hypothetical protein
MKKLIYKKTLKVLFTRAFTSNSHSRNGENHTLAGPKLKSILSGACCMRLTSSASVLPF